TASKPWGVLGCHRPKLFEVELVLDFATVALPDTKPVVSQQPASGAGFPQRRSGEEPQSVGVRVLDCEVGKSGADAHPLERVGNLDRHFGDGSSICIAHVSSDADDRVVAWIDHAAGLVAEVIDIREEGELGRRQLALRGKEPPVARLRGEAGGKGGRTVSGPRCALPGGDS